ncbi:MAG: hypothetical protein R6W91_05970 [Thermoplasmata archaeon]
MKTWRKELSLLLVGMMIMSGLVAFSAPAIADEAVTITSGTGTQYTIAYNDANMYKDPTVALDSDQPIVINEAGNGGTNQAIYLGEDECAIQFVVVAGANPGVDVRFQLQTTTDSGPVKVGEGVDELVTIAQWGGSLTQTIDLTIDTDATGIVERSYPLNIRVTEDPSGTPVSGNIGIDIYISSIFHDRTNMDTAHVFTRVSGDYVKDNSTGGDAPFEAGDEFKAAFVAFQNRALINIKDPQITLTAPTTTPANQITLVHTGVAKYVGAVATMTARNLNWRVNVAENTPPGVYAGTAAVQFVRTVNGVDVTINEATRNIDYTVDYNFKDTHPYTPGTDTLWSEFQCYATNVEIIEDETRQIDYSTEGIYDIPTIEQDTYTDRKIKVNVTIINNGNSDLFNLELEIIPGTSTTLWTYFRNPKFFWPSSTGTVSYDTITDTFDLAVGEERTFTIEMIVLKNIPIGEHRLPILYRGFYVDDGALGGSTGFMATNGGADLQIIFSIAVADEDINCLVTSVTAGTHGDKANIVAETITVNIQNNEKYAFIHVMVRANFTGTPWYMPVINMRNPLVWANNMNEVAPLATAWAAGASIAPTFTVDTDPSFVPDRYPFQVEITAVIEETLEIVSVTLDYRHGAVIDLSGYGPRIQIAAFTAEDIVPGKGFDMVLTIENVGDETLRDVFITIPCDDTEVYDSWDFERDFKDQFDWTEVFSQWGDSGNGGGVAWTDSEFPSEMFYTMESLDVDNVREIVEINLYADGVYSKPGARIELIRIIDLAPGATFDVTYDMFADKDMVNGKPYTIEVTVHGINNAGSGPYSGDGETFDISVMSSLPGESYNPVELNWFDAGLKALALFLFFIIVLAILLFVYNMFKGEPYDDGDEDFDNFEDDNEPFEPAEAPAEAPQQELVEP